MLFGRRQFGEILVFFTGGGALLGCQCGPFGQPVLKAFLLYRCQFGILPGAGNQAALLGAGISVHPYYMVSEDLAAGRLEVVLPECVPEELDIYVVYSTRRNMPTRVRHLIDFLKDWARQPPDWSAPKAAPAPPAGPRRAAG